MNKEWSELNKTLQVQLKRKATFDEGIDTLLLLRQKLMAVVYQFKEDLDPADFSAMPYSNAKGYHNKTIAYSLWHVFRIEDIVAQSLIRSEEQIFFTGGYRERISSPIITTGNELVKQQIAAFSEALNLEELYAYCSAVKASTDGLLKQLTHAGAKRKMTAQEAEYLTSLQVVSDDEQAAWLIDYWCKKDVLGLIRMPFSRHWLMHIEASLRIKDKLCLNR